MTRQIITLTLIFIFTLASKIQKEQPKLIFVQQIFGYGARYPDQILGIGEKFGPQYQTGKLTKQGKSMHYLLGKKMYETYWQKLFGGTHYQSNYNQSRFRVESTDDDCTIQSAQSHIFGILEALPPLQLSVDDLPFAQPPFPEVQAVEGAVYGKHGNHVHPIPIHIMKENIFAYEWDQSPDSSYTQVDSNQQNGLQQKWSDAKTKKMLKDPAYVSVLNQLSRSLNKTISPFNFSEYYYNLECMYYSRLLVSTNFSESLQIKRILNSYYILSSYIRFFIDKQQFRVTASKLFEEIISSMHATINSTNAPQWVMQSADHMKIGIVLSIMDLWNSDCIYQSFVENQTENGRCVTNFPIFGSLLVFELYKLDNSSHIVKANFNGKYLLIPFCHYRAECTLEQFQAWFQTWRIRKIKNKIDEPYYYITETSLTILGFMIACLVHQLTKRAI